MPRHLGATLLLAFVALQGSVTRADTVTDHRTPDPDDPCSYQGCALRLCGRCGPLPWPPPWEHPPSGDPSPTGCQTTATLDLGLVGCH